MYVGWNWICYNYLGCKKDATVQLRSRKIKPDVLRNKDTTVKNPGLYFKGSLLYNL